MTKDMTSLPDHVKGFNDELAEMLTQKPPVSSSKMKDITRSAMKGQKYYKHIVMSVEKLIQKCKPEFKLSGVYVIDAIVRQSRHQNKDRDTYAGRFEANIHITATHLFKSSRSDQVKICRTFKLWELNRVFSYHAMQKCLNCTAPDVRKEGIQLAEKAKMAIKPVQPAVSSDILKQQRELEEQRKKIHAQEEELKKKQDLLLQSTIIPPILGNLLNLGSNQQTESVPAAGDKETANKVKSLLDDFDYSDEDEIKQPSKKGTPKSRTASTTGSVSTPKKTENLSTPSPVTSAIDTSLYDPDPPEETIVQQSKPKKQETYDTKSLEKLYTPSPIEKTTKRSKHKSPERTKEKKSHKRESRRESEREKEKPRDRERSRDRMERDASRERDTSRETSSRSARRSSVEGKRGGKSSSRAPAAGASCRGKRSRSSSPDHYSKKRDRITKPDCVSVLSTTIWIGNLRKTVTKEDISSLMKKYTDSCTIDMVPPRGCSYINIGDRSIAETVLKELKDLKLHGAPCKVAWAPGKGCKEYREHWNIEKGVTFIPYKTFEKLKISGLEDGGLISEPTLPPGFKLQESEGAGSILEKLLVSMKECSHQEGSLENPLGQFLTNGTGDNIKKQEQQVSAKLDKLDEIAIPARTSDPATKVRDEDCLQSKGGRDEDSIVHLLNSKEYSLPMPDNSTEEESYYYPDHPGMSPPVKLDIPEEVEEMFGAESPVAEEPLPYSRPVDTPVKEPPLTESPAKAEKKTINLQTYLKRKKDDDLIEPARSEEGEEPVLPPTPAKTPRENDVDDLLEWASQDSQALEEEEDGSPDKMEDEVQEVIVVKEDEKVVQKEEETGDVSTIADGIRSPSSSPVDSLLEEKLASPSAVAPGDPPTPEDPPTPVKVPSIADVSLPPAPSELEVRGSARAEVRGSERAEVRGSERAEVRGSERAEVRGSERAEVRGSERAEVRGPRRAEVHGSERPGVRGSARASDNKLDAMEEGELEPESEEDAAEKTGSSRSRSQSKKMKKDRRKKDKKKKKKKDKNMDSDLEEDIRKLEYLKAELEREERREKREKDRKREGRKRSASPRLNKEKRKKEKRARR